MMANVIFKPQISKLLFLSIFSFVIFCVSFFVFVPPPSRVLAQSNIGIGNTSPTAPSKFGKAAYQGFSSYVSVQNSSSLQLKLNSTLEVWIKAETPAFTSVLISKSKPQQKTFSLAVASQVAPFSPPHTYQVTYGFETLDSGRNCKDETGMTRIITTRSETQDEVLSWKQLALVVGADKSLNLYINGVKSATGTLKGAPCETSSPVTVGAQTYLNVPDKFFFGALDELRISSTARYTDNFTPATDAFSNDPFTTLLYHFDGNLTNTAQRNYQGTGNGQIFYLPVEAIFLEVEVVSPQDNATYPAYSSVPFIWKPYPGATSYTLTVHETSGRTRDTVKFTSQTNEYAFLMPGTYTWVVSTTVNGQKTESFVRTLYVK